MTFLKILLGLLELIISDEKTVLMMKEKDQIPQTFFEEIQAINQCLKYYSCSL